MLMLERLLLVLEAHVDSEEEPLCNVDTPPDDEGETFNWCNKHINPVVSEGGPFNCNECPFNGNDTLDAVKKEVDVAKHYIKLHNLLGLNDD